MKKLVRPFAREVVSIYLATRIATGLVFGDELTGIIITGVALTLASFFVKPIINILILPLTLATLGLFKFLAHAITLYIIDTALPQFAITGFNFPGFSSQYFDLPPLMLDEGPLAVLAFSIVISITTSILHWIAK